MKLNKISLLKGSLVGLLGMGILANVSISQAHNWWSWHWHSGNTVSTWVGSLYSAEANAALNDWDSHSDINFPRSSSHTEMSVFAGNYGATGWWGLASIEDYSYDWWHKWNYSKINHCHARFNTYYGGSTGTGSGSDVRGVFCQEIGHCIGLDHSDHGCMGKGYFNNSNVTVSHNWSDVNARY